MIEQLIFNTLLINDEQQKDINCIFNYLKLIPSNILLAINTYISYILHKRGVI